MPPAMRGLGSVIRPGVVLVLPKSVCVRPKGCVSSCANKVFQSRPLARSAMAPATCMDKPPYENAVPGVLTIGPARICAAQACKVVSALAMQPLSSPGKPLVCENNCASVMPRFSVATVGHHSPTVLSQRRVPRSTKRPMTKAETHLLAEAMATRVCCP